jgi:hypothetical protein
LRINFKNEPYLASEREIGHFLVGFMVGAVSKAAGRVKKLMAEDMQLNMAVMKLDSYFKA